MLIQNSLDRILMKDSLLRTGVVSDHVVSTLALCFFGYGPALVHIQAGKLLEFDGLDAASHTNYNICYL